jgi:hypothetical protein
MSRRTRVSVSVLTAVVAVLGLATGPAGGQASSAASASNGRAAKAYTPPRTPDGQPDLQGFWTNSTYTPLERPNGVTKEFYTLEEVLEAEKRAAERESEQTKPGTRADVHYDFTQFGLDRSQSTRARSLRTSLIVDPPDGRLPPLSADGRKRAAEAAEASKRVGRFDSAETTELDDRCLIVGGAGPPMTSIYYNSNYHIVQARGYVMILVEMIHDARIIPLDRRPQPHRNVRQWMGVSRGRWEGDTLVVETTNFNGKNPFRGSEAVGSQGVGGSENMRVIERFSRVADDSILYRFTVDDPTTWSRPWTAEMPMRKTVGPIFEYACHEGNYSMYNALVGARLEEKKAAEAAARKGSK